MATVKTAHQYAGDARVPFSFGGSGNGRIHIVTSWTAAEVESVLTYQAIWKAAKRGFISNMALATTRMDVHATETLEWNIGTTTTGAEIYSGTGTTFGEFAGSVLTELVHPLTDVTTESGLLVPAATVFYLSVEEAAATGAAGTLYVSFDITYL